MEGGGARGEKGVGFGISSLGIGSLISNHAHCPKNLTLKFNAPQANKNAEICTIKFNSETQ